MLRLLLAGVGTIFAAVVGWVIAMIIGAAVSGVTGDFLPQLRDYEGLIGAVSGGLAGGTLAYQGKHDKRYGMGLFSRVALVGSGLPFIRLALYQNHWPTATVFLVLGSSLFLGGCFLVLDIVLGAEKVATYLPEVAVVVDQVHDMGAIALLTYAPLGLAMILFGAYATGQATLTCQRLGPTEQIDCQLEESRWLGLVKQERRLQDVQEASYDFGVMTLRSRHDEVRLVGGIVYDVFVIEHAFQTFLDSTRPAMNVSIGPRWILFGISLVAGILVWQGIASTPLTARPESGRWRRTRRIVQAFESPALIFGLVTCLWGISFFLIVVPDTQAYIGEQENTPLLVEIAMAANLPEGTVVFVEGHLSENNEVLLHDFVMYTVARYVSDEWQTVPLKSMTPPFWIDLPGEGRAVERRLRISNDTYGLDQSYELPRVWSPDEEVEGETLRYSGYGRGDFVSIEGQIERMEGDPQLVAWIVYGEPVEEIVEGSRSGLKNALIGGGIFFAIGLGLLVIFVYNFFNKFKGSD